MLEKEQLLPSISPTLTLGSSPGGAQPTVLRCAAVFPYRSYLGIYIRAYGRQRMLSFALWGFFFFLLCK